MFRKPHEGEQKGHLHDDQFEFSQAFLARERRMLFLRGPIFGANFGPTSRVDSFSPSIVGDDILAMNVDDPKAPIYLYIDSPGGDVGAGMVLYDIIRMSRAPIVTVAPNCASMATVLMAAGAERVMYPHSRVMLHLPKGAFEGDAETFEIRSKELQRVKEDPDCAAADIGLTTLRLEGIAQAALNDYELARTATVKNLFLNTAIKAEKTCADLKIQTGIWPKAGTDVRVHQSLEATFTAKLGTIAED
ncbi:hypothetical protein LCGC14_2412060, partial [marine sediment metagenome]